MVTTGGNWDEYTAHRCAIMGCAYTQVGWHG